MTFMFLPKVPGLLFSSQTMKQKISQIIEWRGLSVYVCVNLLLTILCFGTRPFFASEKMWFIVIGPIYALIYLGIVNALKTIKTLNAWEANYEV